MNRDRTRFGPYIFWHVFWFLGFLSAACLMPPWEQGAVAAETPPPPGLTAANDAAKDNSSLEYHTPLAGEPLYTVFMGQVVDVPARDRGHVTSLTLGGHVLCSEAGEHRRQPHRRVLHHAGLGDIAHTRYDQHLCQRSGL